MDDPNDFFRSQDGLVKLPGLELGLEAGWDKAEKRDLDISPSAKARDQSELGARRLECRYAM